MPLIAHFTVTVANEAGVDLVLIQPFLHYYAKVVVVMLHSIFSAKFPLEKEGSLYQNKVNLSLKFTQRLGHQAHNCKIALAMSGTKFSSNAELYAFKALLILMTSISEFMFACF